MFHHGERGVGTGWDGEGEGDEGLMVVVGCVCLGGVELERLWLLW